MSIFDPDATPTPTPDEWSYATRPAELEIIDPPYRPARHLCFLAIRPSGAKGRHVGIATCPDRGCSVMLANYRPTDRTKARKGFTFWTNRKPVPDGWYDNRKSPVMREHWVGNHMVARYDSIDCVPHRPLEHGGILPAWGTYPDLPLNP